MHPLIGFVSHHHPRSNPGLNYIHSGYTSRLDIDVLACLFVALDTLEHNLRSIGRQTELGLLSLNNHSTTTSTEHTMQASLYVLLSLAAGLLIAFVATNILYPGAMSRWLARKNYQYEVSFGGYMLTPTEKFILSTSISHFLLLVASLVACFL